MKTIELLEHEIDMIKTEEIKHFTIESLKAAPDYFWRIPASSSGKYHPLDSLGKGGLVRHTKKVVYFADKLCEAFDVVGIKFDIVLSASLLHDTLKTGTKDSGHTVDEHPILPREYFGELSELTDHYDRIMDCIQTHMGIWGPEQAGIPEDKLQYIVHLSDYLASRKEVSVKTNNKAKSNGDNDKDYYQEYLNEDLIKEYLRLKQKEKKIKNKTKELRKILLEKMDEKEDDMLVSTSGVAKRNRYYRKSYDPLLIKEFIPGEDLWESILAVDNKKIKELIKDEIVHEDDLRKALLEEKEITYLRVYERE